MTTYPDQAFMTDTLVLRTQSCFHCAVTVFTCCFIHLQQKYDDIVIFWRILHYRCLKPTNKSTAREKKYELELSDFVLVTTI